MCLVWYPGNLLLSIFWIDTNESTAQTQLCLGKLYFHIKTYFATNTSAFKAFYHFHRRHTIQVFNSHTHTHHMFNWTQCISFNFIDILSDWHLYFLRCMPQIPPSPQWPWLLNCTVLLGDDICFYLIFFLPIHQNQQIK